MNTINHKNKRTSCLMGSCSSVDESEKATKEGKSKEEEIATIPKKQVDRENLVQTQKKDIEIVRNPGDISGNQFIADELDHCKVIVNDICDSMTIDRCVNCELILSAVRGSVFIRDCVDSKFQIVCGQFRCRSCTNCDFFMHVKTGPIIESSKDVRIGCSTLFYPDLINQMKQLRLDPFTNCWTDIHDFTPEEGNFSYSNHQKLTLDIMDNSGKCLPFTHRKDGNDSVFNVKINEEKCDELIEKSYVDSVVLLSAKKDGDFIICSFQAKSKNELENQINDLNPVFID